MHIIASHHGKDVLFIQSNDEGNKECVPLIKTLCASGYSICTPGDREYSRRLEKYERGNAARLTKEGK